MTPIKTMVTRTLWPVLKKPWATPTMEFRYGLWRGLSALMAEDGRQLGEDSTRPFYLNKHIPAQTMECKYGGSRNGHTINVSALGLAMAHFDAALEIVGAVRMVHIEKSNGRLSPDIPFGLWDLHIVSRACLAIIAFKIRSQSDNKKKEIVSNALKSQYQFISGVFMICRHMMNNGNSAIEENKALSTEELYAYADENKIFESPNGMVCAGAPKAIVSFLHFCVVGKAFSDVNKNKKNSMASTVMLERHVGNVDRWYQYSLSCIGLDFTIERELLRQKMLYDQASTNTLKRIDKIYAAVEAYCELGLSPEYRPKTDDLEENLLQRQNAILALLNLPPIEAIPEKYVTERLAL